MFNSTLDSIQLLLQRILIHDSSQVFIEFQITYPKKEKREKGFRCTKFFPAIAYIVLLMSEKHLSSLFHLCIDKEIYFFFMDCENN